MNQQVTVWDILDIQQANVSHNRFEESLDADNVVGEAWQYKMRKEYAKQESAFPYWEDYDLSLNRSEVREVSYSEAKRVIDKYEWLGCMPVCVRHCYGIFFPHKSDGSWLLGGSRSLLKNMLKTLVFGISMDGRETLFCLQGV